MEVMKMDNIVKMPKGHAEHEPEYQVRKAKGKGIATTEKIVKNLL